MKTNLSKIGLMFLSTLSLILVDAAYADSKQPSQTTQESQVEEEHAEYYDYHSGYTYPRHSFTSMFSYVADKKAAGAEHQPVHQPEK